jgi:hypothetical protein
MALTWRFNHGKCEEIEDSTNVWIHATKLRVSTSENWIWATGNGGGLHLGDVVKMIRHFVIAGPCS